jgi:superfamily II DNA or RNA helicase
MPAKGTYRSYKEAKKFAIGLGLKDRDEWRNYCKSGRKPKDIPATPHKVFKYEFEGYGAFLGTGNIATFNKVYLPYKEAKNFAISLGLNRTKEWFDYCKSRYKPEYIPSHPEATYKDEFEGWGEFLGTEKIVLRNRAYRSYGEASKFAISLRLKSSTEWDAYCKTGYKPEDIPSAPYYIYNDEFNENGGWPGFLGTIGNVGRWTSNALSAYIKEMLPELKHFPKEDLFQILNQAGAFPAIMKAFDVPTVEAALKQLRELSGEEIMEKIKKVSDEGFTKETIEGKDYVDSEDVDEPELSDFMLHSLDNLGLVDETTKDAIAERFIHKLWHKAVIDKDPNPTFNLINGDGGKYFSRIKERFTSEYEKVSNLKVPKGWSFSVDGKIEQPSLMQKRVAWLLKKEKSLLNLSGAGAGKTLSGILASQYVGAKLTVVVLHNPTMTGWEEEIMNAYPKSKVVFDCEDVTDSPRISQYLLLNYEQFQMNGDELADKIIKLEPDMFIIDEIQFMKERGKTEVSKRRQVLHGMIEECDYSYVLALTATPCINDLIEPKTLLETILRRTVNIATKTNQQNALSMYYLLQKHSVRFKPNYGQDMKFTPLTVTKNTLLKELVKCEHPLEFEQVLLDTKLKLVKDEIKKGTVIYTQFVEGIVDEIKDYVEKLGFSVGEYTGNNKGTRETHKKAFINKKIDVLIISQSGRVGLDGLQKRSNRMILIGTPWTAADWEQLVGRLLRQGSLSKSVTIIHPQVVVKGWSWDKSRLGSVNTKKTLADCVVDGVLMNTDRVTQAELLSAAKKSLQKILEKTA